MRLDVSVANANGMDVRQRTEELVHVELDLEHGHCLLELGVMTRSSVDSLRYQFKHKIEVYFVLLVAVGVEECPKVDNVGMMD